jgi:predicted nucleotidyltransferase
MRIPVQTKEDIAQRLRDAREQLATLGVSTIGLFGSFVTGRQTPESDVDFLVDFAPGEHSFDNFMELSFLLEDLMGRKVELLTRESLSPHIGPHILREVEPVSSAA